MRTGSRKRWDPGGRPESLRSTVTPNGNSIHRIKKSNPHRITSIRNHFNPQSVSALRYLLANSALQAEPVRRLDQKRVIRMQLEQIAVVAIRAEARGAGLELITPLRPDEE